MGTLITFLIQGENAPSGFAALRNWIVVSIFLNNFSSLWATKLAVSITGAGLIYTLNNTKCKMDLKLAQLPIITSLAIFPIQLVLQ